MVLEYQQEGHYTSYVHYSIDLPQINRVMQEHYDMSEVGEVTEDDIYNCLNGFETIRGDLYVVHASENSYPLTYFETLSDVIYDYRDFMNEEMSDQEITDEEFCNIV